MGNRHSRRLEPLDSYRAICGVSRGEGRIDRVKLDGWKISFSLVAAGFSGDGRRPRKLGRGMSGQRQLLQITERIAAEQGWRFPKCIFHPVNWRGDDPAQVRYSGN